MLHRGRLKAYVKPKFVPGQRPPAKAKAKKGRHAESSEDDEDDEEPSARAYDMGTL